MNKKYLAEFVGTFALVFCGTGAIVINEQTGGLVTHIGIAITFGVIVTAMIYAVGDISGAHLNPAVTVGFVIAKKFTLKELFPYVFSQMAGAVLASSILKLFFPGNLNLGATFPSVSRFQAFNMEVFLTFVLMMVILYVASGSKERGYWAAVVIGFVVFLEAFFAGHISGASMNPARSFAPAFVSGQLQFLWVYLTAPFVGAALAVALRVVFSK
jgi:aquaporin NIP